MTKHLGSSTQIHVPKITSNSSSYFGTLSHSNTANRTYILPNVDMQISFLKDLVTLRNPCSSFSFINYLYEKNRLEDFINLRRFYTTREEFHDYFIWAANKVSCLVHYGSDVVSIDLQNDLIKKWGYKGSADGKFNLSLQSFINDLADKRAQLPQSLQGADFRTFLSTQDKSVIGGTSATGGGAGQYTPTTNIYSANEAANTVQSVISALLDRDATAQEVKSLSSKLIAAQSDPKNAVRQKVNKYGVLETTGGINASQFIEDLIRGGEEYKGLVAKGEAKKQSAIDAAKNTNTLSKALDKNSNMFTQYSLNAIKSLKAASKSKGF